jgi:hypothetical protein
MFDRYAEKARRVIFFARYEASQFGTSQIESEHVLLGLLREDRFLFRHLMPSGWTAESVRKKIEFGAPVREMVSTSVDMPVSSEVKRILTYAAEEAESLGDAHIETKHLLLGILHEEDCVAAKLLHEDGVRLSTAREIMGSKKLDGEIDTGAAFVPIPSSDFAFSAYPEETATESPFRRIEFLNEADGKVLAVAPGSPVPQIGSEVILGSVRAHVAKVVYEYDKPWTPVSDEAHPVWHPRIIVYVQVISVFSLKPAVLPQNAL